MLGIVLALVGTIFLSGADTGKKKLTQQFEIATVVWLTVVVCLALSIANVIITGVPQIGWLEVVSCLVPCVIATVASELLFMRAIKISDLSLSIPLCAFGPIFTLILGFLILNETPTLFGIGGIALTTIGAYVLFLEDSHGLNIFAPFRSLLSQAGPRYILYTTILFPIAAILQKIGSRYSSSEFFFMLMMGGMFIAWSFGLLRLRLNPVTLLTKAPVLSISTALLWGIGLLTLFLSFNLTLVAYALAIKQIGIILSVLLGYVFFNEPFFLKRLTAGSIMVVGVLIVVLQ